jgi:hypothetical protein
MKPAAFWNEAGLRTSLKLKRLNARVDSISCMYVERADAIATGAPLTVAVDWIGPWTLRSARKRTSRGGAGSVAAVGVVTEYSRCVNGVHFPL